MDKKELLKKIKENLRNSNIRFPKGLDIHELNHTVAISMQDGIVKNMQENSAAFEGWILCIKAAVDTNAANYKFILDWKEPVHPNKVDQQHYQRFLYRVFKFDELCGGDGGWFTVKDKHKLTTLKIRYNNDTRYFLNMPSSEDSERINDSKNNVENTLENYIVKNQSYLSSLKSICNAKLKRQLPVGVFKDDVCKENTILPRSKSAIDIWGVYKNALYLFELKAKNNNKVGALSELFFYAMIMHDVQNKNISRGIAKNDDVRCTNRIIAYILAPSRHPLITKRAFSVINNAFEKKNMKITFGHIKFVTKGNVVVDDFSICNS